MKIAANVFDVLGGKWNAARLALVAAWGAALCLLFTGAVWATIDAFILPANDMMHGWVVPPVAIAMMATRWRELRASAGRPAWGGLVLLFAIFALCWVGERGSQSRFNQVAMVLAIPAVVWTGWGWNAARLLLYPTAFMFFIVPLNFMADPVTLPLRLFSSECAAGLLNGFGADVLRDGSALVSATGKFNLDVADPCSGIKSIFAIIALAMAYGFFHQKTTLRAMLLIASGVPLAVFANIMRLTLIGGVASIYGQDSAMQVFHDFSGFITFPVALLSMLAVGEMVIRKIGRVKPRPPAAPPARQAPWPAGIAFLALALVATVGMEFAMRNMPPTVYDPDTFIARKMPSMLGNLKGQPIWYCHQPKCDAMYTEAEIERINQSKPATGEPREKGTVPWCPVCAEALHPDSLSEHNALPNDTRIMKAQYGEGEDAWTVTVVVSGKHRVSIHRPELCLPGQGYAIDSKTVHTLALDNGRRLDVMEFRVAKAGVPPISFINFLAAERLQTASHFTRISHDVLQRTLHGRVNRWAMFTFVGNKPVDTPGELERLRGMLSAWLPQVYLVDAEDVKK